MYALGPLLGQAGKLAFFKIAKSRPCSHVCFSNSLAGYSVRETKRVGLVKMHSM